MSKVARTATNYQDWMEQQATAAYADDQRRYAPVTAPTTKFYADTTGRVLLGQKDIADAQYAADEAAGGLLAVLMNRGR